MRDAVTTGVLLVAVGCCVRPYLEPHLAPLRNRGEIAADAAINPTPDRRSAESTTEGRPDSLAIRPLPPVESVHERIASAIAALDQSSTASGIMPVQFEGSVTPRGAFPPAPHEELPVGDPTKQEKVEVSAHSDRVSITAEDAPLSTVLGLLAKQHGLSIITEPSMTETLTLMLNDVAFPDALNAVLSMHGYTWSLQGNVLYVTSLTSQNRAAPGIQGRVLRIFPLNYVAAAEVDKVIKGLMSPVGQSYVLETNPADQRRTQESVIVEDLPAYLARVEDYIRQVDYPPRQVVVEARILQVKLDDNMKQGVNLEELLNFQNTQIRFQTTGFASPTASPAGFVRIDGTQFNMLLEVLHATLDTKTLASPKVAVVNGQQARIQIGGQIGYLTTTSTITSTVQTVNFLDTGVILTVTPIITEDGQILLAVKPEVSTGRINETTTLPESETTEVETRVMMADGESVVIGGLINERDVEQENKVIWLGNIPYVGALFRRKVYERQRTEVIIILTPRIVCDVPGHRQADPRPAVQALTPLFVGPMKPVDRSAWEPRMRTATPIRTVPPPPVMTFEPSVPIVEGPASEAIFLPPDVPLQETLPPPEVIDALPISSP